MMRNALGLSNRQLLLLLGTIVFNYLVYNGGRILAADVVHYSLASAFDHQIPLLSRTVWIYWGCYIFWVVNYYIGTKYDKDNGYGFIGAHYIGEAICFIFFVFFPTIMVRPEITGNSISDWIIKLTYQQDEANNLFPSIHCFASWLCWIGVRRNSFIPKWYQMVSLVIAVLVCVSTLTVKQHVIADVPAGILLAEGSYLLSLKLEKITKTQQYVIVSKGS